MPKKKAQKPVVATQSSLAGWSAVFTEQRDQADEKEKLRKVAAQAFLDDISGHSLYEKMRLLFTGAANGQLNNREFFDAAHEALDLPKLR